MADVERTTCYPCEQFRLGDDAPPRERVLRTAHWGAAHAFGTALPGWLVLLPARHLTHLAELDVDEAAELGGLLRRLTAALQDELGCVKTYVILLAEAEGFSHLHFHVVPRMPDLPAELQGPRIFDLMRRPSDEQVSEAERDRLAVALARRLSTG